MHAVDIWEISAFSRSVNELMEGCQARACNLKAFLLNLLTHPPPRVPCFVSITHGFDGMIISESINNTDILLPMGSFSFFLREILRDRERARRSEVFPEWAVVHSEVSCSDWLLVSLAALWDLNILRQKSFRPRLPPCICSSLQRSRE